MSDYAEKSFKNVWNNLNENIRAKVKNDLFVALDLEGASNVRNLICDAIGEIGGCLISE